MFLLDTNVISESRKIGSGRADPSVVAWLKATDPSTTFTSAMTIFEIALGVEQAAYIDPAQGRHLRRWLDQIVKPGFSGRIIALDDAAACTCAQLHVPDPVSPRDAWIAAVARIHNLTVVTRNVGDFERTGVRIINPWEHRP